MGGKNKIYCSCNSLPNDNKIEINSIESEKLSTPSRGERVAFISYYDTKKSADSGDKAMCNINNCRKINNINMKLIIAIKILFSRTNRLLI